MSKDKVKPKSDKSKGLFKEVLVIVSVLAVISALCGLVLGVVVPFTEIDQQQAEKKKMNALYLAVYQKDIEDINVILSKDEKIEYSDSKGVYASIDQIQSVNTTKDNIKKDAIYIIEATGYRAYKQYIKIYVLVENGVVKGIQKLYAKETPGLGDKAFKDSHYSQFIGQELSEMGTYVSSPAKVTDPKDKVVSISGATYTTNAFNGAMNAVVEWYRSINE